MQLEADVTIQGIKPLLFNYFGPEAIPLIKMERSGVAGNDPEEWTRTVLLLQQKKGKEKDCYKYNHKQEHF